MEQFEDMIKKMQKAHEDYEALQGKNPLEALGIGGTEEEREELYTEADNFYKDNQMAFAMITYSSLERMIPGSAQMFMGNEFVGTPIKQLSLTHWILGYIKGVQVGEQKAKLAGIRKEES